MSAAVSQLLHQACAPFDPQPLTAAGLLEEGYAWSERPRAFQAAAVTPGSRHVMQLVLDEPDIPFAQELLEFACSAWDQLLGQDGPVRIAHGFRPKGHDFDSVVAIQPDIHGMFNQTPALHALTFWVAGAHGYEVPPDLTPSEAAALTKLVRFIDRGRAPRGVCRTRMSVGGAKTKGERRSLTSEKELLPYVRRLSGDPHGHIEIENAAGSVATLRWDRTYIFAHDRVDSRLADDDDAVDKTREFIRRRVHSMVTRPAGTPVNSGHALSSLVTLETEDGTVADALSDWQLRDELGRVAPGSGNRFAILAFAPDMFIQCYANDDGSFDVEHHDGRTGEHYRSKAPVARSLMAHLFVSYGTEDNEDWRSLTEWTADARR